MQYTWFLSQAMQLLLKVPPPLPCLISYNFFTASLICLWNFLWLERFFAQRVEHRLVNSQDEKVPAVQALVSTFEQSNDQRMASCVDTCRYDWVSWICFPFRTCHSTRTPLRIRLRSHRPGTGMGIPGRKHSSYLCHHKALRDKSWKAGPWCDSMFWLYIMLIAYYRGKYMGARGNGTNQNYCHHRD